MIRVQEARAGMSLGADVHDRTGRLLMVAGQAVDDRALRVFRTWGVAEIDVVGADVAAAPIASPGAVDPAEGARWRAEAEDLFRHADRDHPAMAELFQLVLSRPSPGDAWHA